MSSISSLSGLRTGLLIAVISVFVSGWASRAQGTVVLGTRILIDLSGQQAIGPAITNPTTTGASPNDPVNAWNNLVYTDATSASTLTPKIANLVDTSNSATGISAYVTDDFNASFSDFNGGETGGPYADNAEYDSWWVYSFADSSNNPSGQIVLKGLPAYATFDIRFLGSAARVDNLPRLGTYAAVGANSGSVSGYDSYNNVNTVGLIAGIRPDALGNISFTVAPDVSGVSAFINVLDITVSAVPEPASCTLLALGAIGALQARNRRHS